MTRLSPLLSIEQTSYKSAQRFAKKHLVFFHFFIPELIHKCETCSNEANHNLDIQSYLRDLIEKVLVFVAEGKPPDKLLPDQWALANPDKVLQVVTMITARPKSGKTKNVTVHRLSE